MPAPASAHQIAARTEDLEFLAAHRVHRAEAARRLGFSSAKSLDDWARAHGAGHLFNQLTN